MSSMAMALQIFHFARDGLTKVLVSALNDLDPTQIKRLIGQEVVNHQGERMTPLIAAVRNGHYKVVKLLVERFGADVNKCGAIRIDNTLVDDASPLWVAAGAGFINIVRDLVDAGAKIDHRTETGSTPIRAACFDGRLEIVQYLAKCGADIEIPNGFQNTCLMIASYRGQYDTVSFLLDIGADPNKQALCGATALHFAAEFGEPNIIERLLEAGAVTTKTNTGFSPMMLAAEQAKEAIVNLFIARKDSALSKQEIIDAVELLGASFANDQKSYSLESCLKYLRWGMTLRFEDPENPILKPYCAPVPAYENRIESQCMSDLDAIADDENALHMESLIIRERLLRPSFGNEVTIPIVYRGVLLAEEGRYERCIALWLHRLSLLLDSGTCISKDIHRFDQMFSRMIAQNQPIEMNDLVAVLKGARSELSRKKELMSQYESIYDKKGLQEETDGVIFCIIDLLVIGTMIAGNDSGDPSSQKVFNKAVYDIVKLNVRSSSGKTLLHLSTDVSTRANNILLSVGIKFPYEPVASVLVECGSDVNAVDSDKNTPLHLLVTAKGAVRDFGNTHKIINKLVECGAHLDAVNAAGLDPFQSTGSLFIQIILRTHCKVNKLKCLAARAICFHGLEYSNYIPSSLHDFIEMHGSDIDDLPKRKN